MALIFNEETAVRAMHATSACDHRMEVGHYFIDKYRAGAAERGHGVVAAQLRKQGVPLAMALCILGFRSRT